MKRFLITGVSATGISTLTRELAAREYKSIDLDSGEWSRWVAVTYESDPSSPNSPAGPDRDWVWREDRVQELPDLEGVEVLFVSGCAENMGTFVLRFDRIILLAVPDDMLVERLGAKDVGSYACRPEEAIRVLGLVRTIVLSLRRIAHHVVNTSGPIDQTLIEILRLLELPAHSPRMLHPCGPRSSGIRPTNFRKGAGHLFEKSAWLSASTLGKMWRDNKRKLTPSRTLTAKTQVGRPTDRVREDCHGRGLQCPFCHPGPAKLIGHETRLPWQMPSLHVKVVAFLHSSGSPDRSGLTSLRSVRPTSMRTVARELAQEGG